MAKKIKTKKGKVKKIVKPKITRETKTAQPKQKLPTDVLHEMRGILRDFNPYHKQGTSFVEHRGQQPHQYSDMMMLNQMSLPSRLYDQQSVIKDLNEKVVQQIGHDNRREQEVKDLKNEIQTLAEYRTAVNLKAKNKRDEKKAKKEEQKNQNNDEEDEFGRTISPLFTTGLTSLLHNQGKTKKSSIASTASSL